MRCAQFRAPTGRRPHPIDDLRGRHGRGILCKIRSSPNRATTLVRAIRMLIIAG